ncbi:MlaC/ttg2D family ABC transporter substrate-binding protein [Geminicoccus roseus]|uniref:MlaC/ttg2D family ABC transporter substrate-binding protein n=1 Tax=Geminicoccus roseus TaxID=404900 RepID=UPI00040B44B3|nr:ABC transporter substrate-binding protein [Geminicoccus roseus]
MPQTRRRLSSLIARTALLLALGSGALFGAGGRAEAAPAIGPDAFITAFGERAVAALDATRDDPAARRDRFAELMRSDVDMPKIAALVLGRAWRSADPDQRARFTEVFEQHLIGTYSRRFDSYAGERLEVAGQKPAGDDVLVASRVSAQGGQPIEVVWRVRDEGDRWQIIDASVEGVSMVLTWRNEFAAVIEQDGLDGLIDRLAKAQP